MSDAPPNFHISYEKLKKTAEELRGGGDKDAEYWAWRNEATSASDSGEEDDFKSWLKSKRTGTSNQNNRKGGGYDNDSRKKTDNDSRKKTDKQARDTRHYTAPDSKEETRDTRHYTAPDSKEETRGEGEEKRNPSKRKQSDKTKRNAKEENTKQEGYHTLWDPGEWETGSSHRHYTHFSTRTSNTAKGGGVIKLPNKIKSKSSEPHSPIGIVKNTASEQAGPNDFIYSEDSDSDGNFTEDYPTATLINTTSSSSSSSSSVLNVQGIERRIEKCSVEATQCSNTFCKESCTKFLGEGMRKRNSLDVLYDSFEEHHTEIIHLRQELACTVSCGMMYDLDTCQDLQVEGVLWKNVFYLLIQHYRNTITGTSSDSIKATLSQQLEDHIAEGIAFYNMLVRQLQKRYKVNYKHHTQGHNRTQVLALLLLHKLFLWIGDLYRYLSQTRDTEEWGQARNFYLLAQTLAPRNPRPYHQLALLGKYAHRRLHAVYYFTLSLMVRNPFTQSKELLLSVLAELRRKAVLLAKRDSERSKRSQILPGSKEVYSNKVVEWIFENVGDQSLNIPQSDLRKRFVVYLLSCLGGLLSNIDLDRVDPEFRYFNKFYLHYLKLAEFQQDEVYQQLFIVLLYTLEHASHSSQSLPMLETFLTPALDAKRITNYCDEEGDWLCKLHSPLSLLMLFAQSQIASTEIIEQFTPHFQRSLVAWLNTLQTCIHKYRKYTDFTEESVVLKEITLLRGVEVLSSLQNITKPFYLSNLTREQSEDLGRAVLVISTFEKLSPSLTFMNCSDERSFTYSDTPQDMISEEIEETKKEEIEKEEDMVSKKKKEEEEDLVSKKKKEEVEEDSESDGPDIEILSVMRITDNTEEEKENISEDKEDSEMSELREKKEKLLQTLQKKQDKNEEVKAAVKMIQGMRILITVKPKYIVPDTNCFLDSLDKLQRITLSRYKVLIPLVVLDEIAGLCRSKDKGECATLALDMINKFVKDRSVALLTSKGSIMESREFKEERSRLSNDDLILNGVVVLSDTTGHKEEVKDTLQFTRTVVFLTNDSNLRVKAHSYNLAVQSIADFVTCAKL